MTIHFGRHRLTLQRGLTWFLIMILALVAFELFNFSTTEYALNSFFGPHDALGLASWATVLALAFCGIDFAGLSRLFTPTADWRREPREVWFLTLAWLLGAAMNAIMTWWAITSALSENPALGNELVTRQQIMRIVPVFVAALVWLTRIMLIGSLATLGDQLFGRAGKATALHPARPATSRPAPLPERAAPTRQVPAANRGTASGARASSVRSLGSPASQPQPA
ncbi:MAG: hypothetical protein JXN59_13140, partial [Anaerolineae bacterium]|nr:hypothetical protein [Anaerolineae bacterium]